MFSNFDDKNHIAMLAIPAVLSMLIGFSGDAKAAELVKSADYEVLLEDQVRGLDNEREESGGDFIKSASGESNKKIRMRLAVESNDYKGFLKTLDRTVFAEIMTEEAFSELVSQYSLYKSGYKKSPLSFFE